MESSSSQFELLHIPKTKNLLNNIFFFHCFDTSKLVQRFTWSVMKMLVLLIFEYWYWSFKFEGLALLVFFSWSENHLHIIYYFYMSNSAYILNIFPNSTACEGLKFFLPLLIFRWNLSIQLWQIIFIQFP